MKILITHMEVTDSVIKAVYNDARKEDIPRKEFQREVDLRQGRLWTMEVRIGDATFQRHGQMDWEEYYESPLLEVDLVAFLTKNIRSRNAKNAKTDYIE